MRVGVFADGCLDLWPPVRFVVVFVWFLILVLFCLPVGKVEHERLAHSCFFGDRRIVAYAVAAFGAGLAATFSLRRDGVRSFLCFGRIRTVRRLTHAANLER